MMGLNSLRDKPPKKKSRNRNKKSGGGGWLTIVFGIIGLALIFVAVGLGAAIFNNFGGAPVAEPTTTPFSVLDQVDDTAPSSNATDTPPTAVNQLQIVTSTPTDNAIVANIPPTVRPTDDTVTDDDRVTESDRVILNTAVDNYTSGNWQVDYTINATANIGAETAQLWITGTGGNSTTVDFRLDFNTRVQIANNPEITFDTQFRQVAGTTYFQLLLDTPQGQQTTGWVYYDSLDMINDTLGVGLFDIEFDDTSVSEVASDIELPDDLDIDAILEAFNLDRFITLSRLPDENNGNVAHFSRDIDIISIITSEELLSAGLALSNMVAGETGDFEDLLLPAGDELDTIVDEFISNVRFQTSERVNLSDNTFRSYSVDIDLGLTELASLVVVGSAQPANFTVDVIVNFRDYGVPVIVEAPVGAVPLDEVVAALEAGSP